MVGVKRIYYPLRSAIRATEASREFDRSAEAAGRLP